MHNSEKHVLCGFGRDFGGEDSVGVAEKAESDSAAAFYVLWWEVIIDGNKALAKKSEGNAPGCTQEYSHMLFHHEGQMLLVALETET